MASFAAMAADFELARRKPAALASAIHRACALRQFAKG
jgi:hypothetical protein